MTGTTSPKAEYSPPNLEDVIKPSIFNDTENINGNEDSSLFKGLEMSERTVTTTISQDDDSTTIPSLNTENQNGSKTKKLDKDGIEEDVLQEEEAFDAQDVVVETELQTAQSKKRYSRCLSLPIPNSTALARLINKFISKTSKHLPSSPDSAGEVGFFKFFFSNHPVGPSSDPCLGIYYKLCSLMKDEPDAREVLTSFTELISIWTKPVEEGKTNQFVIPSYLLSLAINTAEALVAHSCYDNVFIVHDNNPVKAIGILIESILQVDLSSEETELSLLQFLLTTGCHLTSTNEAMVRGTNLLQTIRICYHIYLKTASEPNKTTARAALQQLVTSVFQRMQNTPLSCPVEQKSMYKEVHDLYFVKSEKFLSNNHRDAFLVLRSLCKLSMKSLPDIPEDTEGNVGLDSKILALELLLYVLEHTDGAAYLNAGANFLFAIRHYLCVSLLKNCTSNLTQVVGLSLRLFVPLIQHFKSHLKTEIEAFVTNVFFVILDSSNSTLEHKTLVVTTFQQICADKNTLAEIFLNYDCDMSAVDLFDRIVNALAKVARTEDEGGKGILNGGHRIILNRRQGIRKLKLEAMMALRQILVGLHASTVVDVVYAEKGDLTPSASSGSFVAMYDTKKKLRTEQTEVILRFNQKPASGLAYAAKCGHLDIDDPNDVARFLLEYKDKLEKTQVGEYLGREAEYKDGFCLQVLHHYNGRLDFTNMLFDDAIRYYLSGFRLPGEAQKIDRIMEKFAERYCLQNPDVFPTADVAFILAFSIIMLNTDLHNPAIKEERRMTKESFRRNNRGICDGGDLPDELLNAIFDRIHKEPISLKEDDEARERIEGTGNNNAPGLYSAVFPSSHFYEIEKGREYAFLKERDHMLRTTESVLKRSKTRKVEATKKTKRDKKFVRVDTGLLNQYVKPMFDVTWGPTLAVYSYAMEATKRELSLDMTDEEADLVEEYGNVNLDICLVSFRLAICTAGICGNYVARDAFVHALYSFTQLGTGRLLTHRNIRCLLLLLKLGREDGELLGNTWEYIFKALSIISRLRSIHDTIKRNDRAVNEEVHSVTTSSMESEFDEDDDSSMSDSEDLFEDEMDRRTIDEANARAICDVIPEGHFDSIYAKSTSLSSCSAKEFILQLCRVSRMEISGYGGHVGSQANEVDLTDVHYRQQHTLSSSERTVHQPVIFSLQKLVEVTHYNMDSRSRLVFAEIWTTVAAHLNSTALHSNAAVAMYAVDSFRQLAIQFLQREELGMFEFQKRFLKPFETVMARCQYVSIKELLLNCMEQIILLFGNIFVKDNSFRKKKEQKYRGALRSGWKPVLAVLGLAGQDSEESIVTAGFKLLNSQVVQALESQDALLHAPKNVQVTCTLLSEHFVDLVESLVMFFGAKIETISLMAMEHVIALTEWLVDESIPLPVSRRRPNQESDMVGGKKSQELELWWPILLGLSRSIGDNRRAVREKSFQTLLDLINSNFLSSTAPSEKDTLHYENELQTLQLIFRGVLTSTLEHAETDVSNSTVTVHPPLPDDFAYFITHPPPPSSKRSTEVLEVLVNDADASEGYTWMDTTFDMLMDACVSICLRSMELHRKDALVEEILAMLNSCLLSENAALAVRGLMRLQQFITVDVKLEDVSENTWAVVCHMLRRCLAVRGLSSVVAAMERISSEQDTSLPPNTDVGSSSVVAAGLMQQRSEDLSVIQDFVVEEEFFSVRRFVASAAVRVIGDLLSDEKFSKAMGMRWLLFLMTGLGNAIQDWESASTVMNFHKSCNGEENKVSTTMSVQVSSPPHYLENALYGRKRMVNLILLLAQKDDVLKNVGIGDMSSAQNLLKEQTESIIQSYLDKEAGLLSDKEESTTGYSKAGELSHFTSLVCELLEGYNKFEDERLSSLLWLCPMLSDLIESNNKSVRSVVHNLVSRMFEGPLKKE